MTTLDEDVEVAQPGHIADHEYIAAVINRMKHICKLTISATSNVLSGSDTDISWDSEVEDDYGYHAASPTPERIIVPAGTPTGWYRATLHVGFPTNSTGIREIILSSSTGVSSSASAGAHGTRRNDLCVSDIFELAALDYVKATAFQNSGGTLALSATNTRISLQRICDS